MRESNLKKPKVGKLKNRSRVAIVISAFILVILVSLISLKRLKPFTFDKESGRIEDYSSFGSKKLLFLIL